MVTETQAKLDNALVAARLYDVPLAMLVHPNVLHGWRRRLKRLDRAYLRAIRAGDRPRATAIRAARRRLYTGRTRP